MLSLTLFFFFVELIVGYVAGSLALVADAFHMLSDTLSLGIGMAARILSTHPTTATNSFGYKRAEVLAGNVNAVFLLTVCFFIIMEAITRLFENKGMEQPVLILIVATIGLVVNIIGIFMFHSEVHHSHSHDDHSHTGDSDSRSPISSESLVSQDIQRLSTAPNPNSGHAHSHGDSNIHGVYLHIMGDLLGSVAVIIAGIISLFVSQFWARIADSGVSFVITLVIIRTTIPLLKNTSSILLQITPSTIDVQSIADQLSEVPGVLGFHDLHIWQLSDSIVVASVHVLYDSDEFSSSGTISQIKSVFHSYNIHSSTIQLEAIPGSTSCAECVFYSDAPHKSLSVCQATCTPTCDTMDRCCQSVLPHHDSP